MSVFDHLLIFLVLVTACFFLDFASSNCSKNSDCRKEEICCAGLTCRPAEKCSLCLVHTHCPDGEKCVHAQCTTDSCSYDRDCYNNTKQRFKCCQGRCTKNSCSSPTSTTQSTTARASCISWRDCSHGEQCERGSCKKTSNVMLTKAGFLSAAILTGSVFLLILCCCFVRESKYSRQRYIERQRRRSRSRSRRRRSRQQIRARSSTTTIAVENRAFSIDDCNACERDVHVPPPEYPTEPARTTDGVEFPAEPAPVTPPPYYTLSFDLPPTYEEALQNDHNDENGGSSTEVA